MRDLMVLLGLLAIIPVAMGNSFIAFLVWGWTAFIAIDSYLYGFMQAARLNLVFAIITLLLVFAKRDIVRGNYKGNVSIALMVAFLIHGFLCALFAYDNNPLNWELFDKLTKTMMFVFVMPLVVVGRYRIHTVLVMICLGMSFHGLIDGLKFLASGGGHIVQGLLKFGDNNHFAVLLAMTIPLLIYLSRYSNRRLVKVGMLAVALLVTAAVIGTHSRGGFISLLAAALWWIISSKEKAAGFFMVVAAAMVVTLAPSNWTERMQTIKSADQDSSFMGRVEAWQVSSAIAIENPVFGGGFHAVQVQEVWNRFKDKGGILGFIDIGMLSERSRAAHSIYFEVLGDLGFVGLFLFVAIMIRALINNAYVSRAVADCTNELGWASDLSRTLTTVLVIFALGGAAVNLAYYEILFVIVMLSEILRRDVANR